MGGPLYFTQEVPSATFESCVDVESSAVKLAMASPLWVYLTEFFPKDQRSLIWPFLSDAASSSWQALKWLNLTSKERLGSRAVYYFVNGKYAFRCRDNKGRYSESHGSNGNPLELTIGSGKGEIWHFSITETGSADVFVITDQRLDQVNGKELMAQLKQRLGSKFSITYVRDDPWFFGYSNDTAPYIFAADRFSGITKEEYLNSNTMVCRTDTGCHVERSHE